MKILDARLHPISWVLAEAGRLRVASAADERKIRAILEDVRAKGDRAVEVWTARLDRVRLKAAHFEVPQKAWDKALAGLARPLRRALERAAERITEFHRVGVPENAWWKNGASHFGKLFVPLDRVGVYAPGGSAGYPSTVLMGAIPAKVAGVREIVVVTPPRKGGVAPALLAAARLSGADRVFQVGGPMAVAALAYGTDTIPRVDKIVGPGNAHVALAKKLLYGRVGLDMPAGPTELVVLADDSVAPDWVAADLAAQVEHGGGALALLVTPDHGVAKAVSDAFLTDRFLKKLPAAQQSQCLAVVVRDWDTAADLANAITPEHAHLMVRQPAALSQRIRNAGAVFVGSFSPVALGDYVAGPNHVLPTDGSARFASPLGVEDFLKRLNFISVQPEDFPSLAPHAVQLAQAEGFVYHAYSVKKRGQTKRSS
ncbi:MAG: histidinol dehydrogenase [Nitrospirae bacterium]|nr:histidinol dehydrogenase [Nitrospirota bacterium]